jgi:oligoribonuclease NrnB/cAMP/cGMP phosphodiesterase (DHH superfamily)
VKEGGLKASLRSTEKIDVSALSGKLYGGGGHPRAAGFRITSYENFSLQVLECVQKIIQEMQSQRGVDITSSLGESKEGDSGMDIVREITKRDEK